MRRGSWRLLFAGKCIAGRGGAGFAAGREIFVAAGPSAEVERLDGGFCFGGASGVAEAGAGIADGDVPFVSFGVGGVGTGAAFFGVEQAELGEMVGGDPAEMRGRVDEERVVSAEEVI